MNRIKIDFGIDLGTTNSAIAKMTDGNPVIIKSEGLQKDTTPSCVHFDRKGFIRVGDVAYNLLNSERQRAFSRNDSSIINTFEEFKRTMGSDDTITPKNTGDSYSPEQLSAEVLKALKSYVRDERIDSVVITVPARFEQHQIDATQKASELAGFKYSELLQEPIAASFAYGIDSKNVEGKWLVFDFGGGTFDVALMSADEGIMRVIDTSGDNHLGGKNLDLAIVDTILLPHLQSSYILDKILADDISRNTLRNALKRTAEEIKINMSSKEEYYYLSPEPLGLDDDGKDIEIDINVTTEDYSKTMEPIFQRAIDITQKLLLTNNVNHESLESILMVGGPTLSQTFRSMVKNQICDRINTSIDPMTVVAKGAALFASTKDIPKDIQVTNENKLQVKLKYPATTVETEVSIGILVDIPENSINSPQEITIEIVRKDGGWNSGKLKLDDFAGIFSLFLDEQKTNTFILNVYNEVGDPIECEPKEFSIIQGMKIASATLPYDICVDAFEAEKDKQHLIPIKGLEKNTSLPAKGTEVFKTQIDIRPGHHEDKIKIPVYGGDPRTKNVYNNYAGIVIITGENLPGFLPKGSDVEITLRMDSSRRLTVQASFPYLDDEMFEETLERYTQETPTYDVLSDEISKLVSNIRLLLEEDTKIDNVGLNKIITEAQMLESNLESGKEDSATKLEILHRLREKLKEFDELKQRSEWPNVVDELNESIDHLATTVEQYGDEKAETLLADLQRKVVSVIENKDSKIAGELISQIKSVDFAVVEQGAGPALWISFLKGFDDEFEMHDWKDSGVARRLINEAKEIIVSNRASTTNLRPIVGELFSLLPRADQPISMKDRGILEK